MIFKLRSVPGINFSDIKYVLTHKHFLTKVIVKYLNESQTEFFKYSTVISVNVFAKKTADLESKAWVLSHTFPSVNQKCGSILINL